MKIVIIIAISIIIIVGIIALIVILDIDSKETDVENSYEPLPRDWQTSGPFQLDRKEYALGEKIFIRIGGLDLQEKGQIAVMRPLNDTHYTVYLTIPFDGENKSGFNYYLDPGLAKTRGMCSVDDVMGKWTLVFRGTDYANLNFEITDRILPGTNWDPVC